MNIFYHYLRTKKSYEGRIANFSGTFRDFFSNRLVQHFVNFNFRREPTLSLGNDIEKLWVKKYLISRKEIFVYPRGNILENVQSQWGKTRSHLYYGVRILNI